MDDITKAFNILKDQVSTDIQKDIDAVKNQGEIVFGNVIKNITDTAAAAPAAANAAVNISGFVDSIKKNAVFFILGIVVIVYIFRPKSGRK